MEPRKFFVWAVYGYNPGNVALLAVFPFNQRTVATAYASATLGGYVIRETRERQPERINPATLTVHKQAEPVAEPLAVAVAVATTFKIWDDVNERYVTSFTVEGNRTNDLTYSTYADATAYATRLNTFGGYGGWASLRFHVREV